MHKRGRGGGGEREREAGGVCGGDELKVINTISFTVKEKENRGVVLVSPTASM